MYSPIITQPTLPRPQEFTASTPVPALVSVKRCGISYLAAARKTKDYNGFLFVQVWFADGSMMWTNADNVRVVPTVTFDSLTRAAVAATVAQQMEAVS